MQNKNFGQQLNEISDKLNVANETIEALNSDINAAYSTITDLETRVEELSSEVDRVTKALTASQNEIATLNLGLESKQNELTTAISERDELTKEIQKSGETNAAEKQKLEKSLEEKETSIKAIQAELQTKANELKTEKEKVDRLEAKAASAENDVEKLTEQNKMQNKNFDQQLNEIRAKLNYANRTQLDLNDQLTSKDQIIADQERKIKQLEECMKQLTESCFTAEGLDGVLKAYAFLGEKIKALRDGLGYSPSRENTAFSASLKPNNGQNNIPSVRSKSGQTTIESLSLSERGSIKTTNSDENDKNPTKSNNGSVNPSKNGRDLFKNQAIFDCGTNAVSANFVSNRNLEDVQKDIADVLKENAYFKTISSNFSNEIIERDNNKGFVRLADHSDKSAPPKKLLDASVDPDRVTVYRRLTEDNNISVENKARVILKSMGIPPQLDESNNPRFSLPEVLLVNGSPTPPEPSTTGRNPGANLVIIEMFKQFEDYKIQYKSHLDSDRRNDINSHI